MKMHFCAMWLEDVEGMEVKLCMMNWKGLKKQRFDWFEDAVRLLTCND
jgi:hypothetical protein